jgi:hypothetical protein
LRCCQFVCMSLNRCFCGISIAKITNDNTCDPVQTSCSRSTLSRQFAFAIFTHHRARPNVLNICNSAVRAPRTLLRYSLTQKFRISNSLPSESKKQGHSRRVPHSGETQANERSGCRCSWPFSIVAPLALTVSIALSICLVADAASLSFAGTLFKVYLALTLQI